MKLLTWMRTIKQNGLIPSKEFKGGFGCLRAQVFSDVQDFRTNSFSFSGSSHYCPNRPEIKEELLFDEEGFCGFLAIGTLGAEPETPKFPALVAEEDITGEKREMAKLITEKLDKFLEDQSVDISGNPVETVNAQGDGETNVCPLQGYGLFGSSIEITKRSNGGVKKIKGLLTRLFKRGQTTQGKSYIEKRCTRDVIKRILEKLHGASSKMRNDDDDGDSMPKKKDLKKSVQICRRKVHPVLHTPARDKNMIENRRKLDLKVPTEGFVGSSSISEENRKKENWIKTDTEYFVLEL